MYVMCIHITCESVGTCPQVSFAGHVTSFFVDKYLGEESPGDIFSTFSKFPKAVVEIPARTEGGSSPGTPGLPVLLISPVGGRRLRLRVVLICISRRPMMLSIFFFLIF